MRSIPILYQDDQLIIFDKPAGLLVTPAPGKTHHILTDIVNEQCDGRVKLYPCHRLDKETSGAIVYAKGKQNQQKMRILFQQEETIEKVYIAFVKGRVKQRSATIRSTIKDHYQKRFANFSRAKLAITRYNVESYQRGFSVLKVMPKTGRTNQIRIHFADMGHPLLGERIYAFRKDFTVDMKRLALHCYSLKFKNPVTKQAVYAVSDVAEDMVDFLKEAR